MIKEMKKLSLLVIFLLVSCSDTEFINEQKVEEVVKYIKTEELKDNFTNLFCSTERYYGGIKNTFLKFNLEDEKAYLFLDYGGKEKFYEKEIVENPSWVETDIAYERKGDLTQWDFNRQKHDVYNHLVFVWNPSSKSRKQFPNLYYGTRININRELLTGWRTHKGTIDDEYEEPCKIITHEELVKRIPTAIRENKESIILHSNYYRKIREEQAEKEKSKFKI